LVEHFAEKILKYEKLKGQQTDDGCQVLKKAHMGFGQGR
jgi:hypothetical protein